MSAKFNSNNRGFSLVEVLVAMGLLTAVSMGVAQLFALSTRANLIAKGQTSTTAMAFLAPIGRSASATVLRSRTPSGCAWK